MPDFMASWRRVCVSTLPEIKELHDQFERSKVEIVLIAEGGEKKKMQEVRSVLQRLM